MVFWAGSTEPERQNVIKSRIPSWKNTFVNTLDDFTKTQPLKNIIIKLVK